MRASNNSDFPISTPPAIFRHARHRTRPPTSPARNLGRKLLWRWLRDRRFSGYKFRRQHPIGSYYLDFFCEEARLNIELDRRQHGFPEEQKHDVGREAFLQIRGIKTLRFWNSHLRRNAQSIRDTIFNELQTRAPHPLPTYTHS
jgi:very-short-patch-repair endonuclease